jgi:hypothetical protein
MWHTYRASWNGADYSAAPHPRPEQLWMRLYRSTPADGFDSVGADRYVREIPADECGAIQFVTTDCEWRGAPFTVHGEKDDDLLLEYTGGEVPVAQRLGLQRIERGVYRRWVPRADVRELSENVVELSQ